MWLAFFHFVYRMKSDRLNIFLAKLKSSFSVWLEISFIQHTPNFLHTLLKTEELVPLGSNMWSWLIIVFTVWYILSLFLLSSRFNCLLYDEIPKVPIYARARDLKHLLDLKKAGATDATLEKAEVLSIIPSPHPMVGVCNHCS
jgi:hypothetical protein